MRFFYICMSYWTAQAQLILIDILQLIWSWEFAPKQLDFIITSVIILQNKTKYTPKTITNKMDNQFISAPLLVSKNHQSVDPKDQLIRGLELKNAKLKTELIKIQRAVEQKLEDERDEEMPKKRESIFQTEDNLENLNKQLVNTYKRIKLYEYEINKLEQSSKTISVSKKSSQIDVIIKEKRALCDKLKIRFTKEQKVMQDNMKKLENNSQKEEIEKHLKSLHDEEKFLKDKIKDLESRETLKQGNMKKQYELIKKLENELLEGGLAAGELDQMKQRAIKRLNLPKVIRQQTFHQPKNKTKRDHSIEQADLSDHEIEDRTRDNYQNILNEINLLQKLNNDYERHLQIADREKQEFFEKNLNSRNRLIQVQNEIENQEKEICFMKSKVIPSNLKPLKPIRSYSSHPEVFPSDVTSTIIKNKVYPAKNLKPSKSLQHILKFDEVGLASENGVKFTDRNILGKSNLMTKITGIKVYVDKIHNVICGIQCTYNGRKKGGDYVRKDKEAREKQYNQIDFVCQEKHYIKNIGGTLNDDDKLESLIITTTAGENQKFGSAKTSKKTFTLDVGSDQYAVCIFGSYAIVKDVGKKQSSQIQHFGFEINNEKGLVHINQFNE